MKAKKYEEKYEELWIKTRYLIRSLTENCYDCDYDEKDIKIKFDSDDE